MGGGNGDNAVIVDTFARDNLPPREQWPEFRFDLPELHIPSGSTA